MKKLYVLVAAAFFMFITGCGGSDSLQAPLSSAKAITAFNISSPVLATGVITDTETTHTIAVTVPLGTGVTNLVATFTTTGASVKVASTSQESGTTPNDFTYPVDYIVTADDNSTRIYTVTVTVSSSLSGFLDTGFGTAGTGGIVTTPIGNSDFKTLALGIQKSDNKIVVAGSSYNGSKYNFALLRYNTDGTLDKSGTPGIGFGTTGIVTTSIGSTNDEAFALAFQSDDSIVVAGSSYNGSNYDFALVRYNTEGILDTTFGTGGTGKVTTSIGSGNDNAYALGIQSDDSIVVAGFSYDGSKYNFALVKYTKDGILDTTFGTAHTGKVTTPIGSGYDYAFALCVQPDDSILVAGRSSSNIYNTTYDFALVKYTKDGILDTTFGTNGVVTKSIGSITAEAHALGVQSDGSIVVAGSTYNDSSSNYDFALVKYTNEGILDTTFGTNGVVTKSIGSNNDFVYALGIQKSDDSIVAAGFSNNGNNYDFALVKYTKDGILDTTFGTGGITTTPIGNSNDYAFALGIQPLDEKIVIAGTFYNVDSSKYDFALVRYLP